MIEKRKEVGSGCLAFFLAPLAAGAVAAIAFVIFGGPVFGFSLPGAHNTFYVFMYSVLLGFVGVIIGAPIYIAFELARVSSVWVYVCTAALLGALGAWLLTTNLQLDPHFAAFWPRIVVQASMTVAAAVAGLAFWVVARPDKNLLKR